MQVTLNDCVLDLLAYASNVEQRNSVKFEEMVVTLYVLSSTSSLTKRVPLCIACVRVYVCCPSVDNDIKNKPF